MDNFVVVSPYAANLNRFGIANNPKNYPYWVEIVKYLKFKNFKVVQIGVSGEPIISEEIDEFLVDLPFPQILELLNQCSFWMSVDNFLPHLAQFTKPLKKGIVIWGKSDPKIFGYPNNFNIYKDKKYFRKDQFGYWFYEEFNPKVFIEPEKIFIVIDSF
ncbi:hypothetical protein [Caldisericum sp.]|uniref:hypothetical protein n=1 Tax=Caldisericum sp. TaxID=2499687 RepID=UPI003D1146A5